MSRTTATSAPSRHLYRIQYRRVGDLARTYRMTVVATSADEARAFAALRDPRYGTTVASPKRGREVQPPESSDGLTAAKVLAEIARMG